MSAVAVVAAVYGVVLAALFRVRRELVRAARATAAVARARSADDDR